MASLKQAVIEMRFKECFAAWAQAYNAKYKHNRNPTLAGLWDDDPDVRAGAAIKTGELATLFPPMAKFYLDGLKKRQAVEKDNLVLVDLMVSIRIVEGVLNGE